MQPISHKALAIGVAAFAAVLLSMIADQCGSDPKTTLGLSLFAFGVAERYLLDLQEFRQRRIQLRACMLEFFRNFADHKKRAPKWSELQKRMSSIVDVESSQQRRDLLNEALTEIVQLSGHKTFVAISESNLQALRRLNDSMEHKSWL